MLEMAVGKKSFAHNCTVLEHNLPLLSEVLELVQLVVCRL